MKKPLGILYFLYTFSIIAITVLSYKPLNAQSAVPPLPELKFAEIVTEEKFLGDRWSYMEAGPLSAPAIVALHGAGGNSMHWRFQLSDLSKHYHVVAWNAPGYLLSDGLKTEEPGCREYADALADFLNALKLTKVYLLGNSFGSRVAQCFAMYYPDRVIKLALVGPSAGPKGLLPEEKAKVFTARRAQVASGGYGFGSGGVEALLGPKAPPELVELVRNSIRATNPRGFMQAVKFGLTNGYSPEEVGASVKIPVLLISGGEDHVSPIATNAEVLQKAIPNARLEILAGIGHLPHLEAPKKLNYLLRGFFRK